MFLAITNMNWLKSDNYTKLPATNKYSNSPLGGGVGVGGGVRGSRVALPVGFVPSAVRNTIA